MRVSFALSLATVIGLAAITPVEAQFENRNIRMSNGVNEDHPNGAAEKAFGLCAAEKSGGKFKVQTFWGGALGGDLQATQALRAGTQEMVVPSTSALVGILPALGVFDLPFLFANEKEADAILDGEFGKYIDSLLPAVGLVNLAWWENGFRNATNSRRAITKWEDFSGIRIRVMQNNIFLDTFKNMGANAVPMNFGEVFTALESKAIDGQENPFVTIETSKFYEVQKYLSVTRHAYTPFPVLYSKVLWDKLSADEQRVLRECAFVGQKVQREANRTGNAKSLEALKAKGMLINELTPQEQARIREQAKPVYDRHAEAIGRDVVNRLLAEIKKVRGN